MRDKIEQLAEIIRGFQAADAAGNEEAQNALREQRETLVDSILDDGASSARQCAALASITVDSARSIRIDYLDRLETEIHLRRIEKAGRALAASSIADAGPDVDLIARHFGALPA